MGPTVLFTHLKIILLHYFQFSVFSLATISSIQTDPESQIQKKREGYGCNIPINSLAAKVSVEPKG